MRQFRQGKRMIGGPDIRDHRRQMILFRNKGYHERKPLRGPVRAPSGPPCPVLLPPATVVWPSSPLVPGTAITPALFSTRFIAPGPASPIAPARAFPPGSPFPFRRTLPVPVRVLCGRLSRPIGNKIKIEHQRSHIPFTSRFGRIAGVRIHRPIFLLHHPEASACNSRLFPATYLKEYSDKDH